MKTKALKGVALVAIAASFALTPSFNVMALEDGSIDYGGNVNQINEQPTSNMLVQATNDGGYVIAGVTGECYSGGGLALYGYGDQETREVSANYYGSCYCGEEEDEYNDIDLKDIVNLENPIICGYVVKYKADGTKVWQKDLTIADYPSMSLVYSYDYDYENDEKIPLYRESLDARPVQLKETSAGIGLMTEDSDFFLLNANTGEIIKSYSHIMVEDYSDEECGQSEIIPASCQSSVDWDIPYWTNINSDGSTTYFDDYDEVFHKKTSAESDSTINYEPTGSLPVATQDKLYVVECSDLVENIGPKSDSEIELYEREHCDLVQLNENFQSRKAIELPSENEFYVAGASDQLVTVITSRVEHDNNNDFLEDAGVFIIKDANIIAQRELKNMHFDYGSSSEIPEGLEELEIIEMASFGANDMVETSDGIAVALYLDGEAMVATFDKNLVMKDTIDLNMSNDDVIYNDLAFLRDGSLTAAGADTNTSDYYDIDGEQNGMHVHYSSIITPSETPEDPNNPNNPNTLDNTIVFGVGLIAMLSTAGCAAKRLIRRR